ncbi:MAG TPA: hypothetical protein VG225_12275 [Terracidiphilus sp.]|nr:hypothetical protein [Terracidiphilus sp.]
MTDTHEITSTLTEKFQAFYELFTEFTHEAAQMHGSLPIRDEASRAMFNSLTRVMAFSDQMNMVLSILREDVRVIDELSTGPVKPLLADKFEDCFYEWLIASRGTSPNVN